MSNPKECRDKLSIAVILEAIGVKIVETTTDKELSDDCWWVSGPGLVNGELVIWGVKIYRDRGLISPRYWRAEDCKDGHYWWNIWESRDGGKTFNPTSDNKVCPSC